MSKQFLKEYLNAYSPVTQETEGQNVLINITPEWIEDVKNKQI